MSTKKPIPDHGLVPDAAATFASGTPASKARFLPVDTKYTEFGYGIVHLYRDRYETSKLYSTALTSEAVKDNAVEDVEKLDDEALKTIAILAVPSYMNAPDFLGFVGAEISDSVSHIRMVKTEKLNRYMALIKFREKEKAAEFMTEFNGKVFNSMDPESCQVVYVKKIEYISPTPGTTVPLLSTDVFPSLSNDPFSPSHSPVPPAPSTSSVILSAKPAPPPTPSLIELPTCPVCLERMDDTAGLLTILCQHVFHCACLSKWRDSSCPVCRYTLTNTKNDPDETSDVFCFGCAEFENLWICLICGNIGCGRYEKGHAIQHYKETGHAYSMDIESQRVWDYVGDNYVHRLIQNKSDGKLVELPSTSALSEGDDSIPKEKLDSMAIEYTSLLTSQLENQRTYFEGKVAQAADKAAAAVSTAEKAAAEAAALTSQVTTLTAKLNELTTDTIPSLRRANERAEAKAAKFADMARVMEKNWKEEKHISEGLVEKIKFLEEKLKAENAENADLKEQVRDLMFYMEAQSKLKDAGEDVKEGLVEVAEKPQQKGKGKKKGKK
ncbi:zf-UBP-domain-containing protein [Ascodesmis nigricans]|uniref:Zf-UBP-domain-containing protein n=1 Tax=Ascodesmis nigricans TaxID=341454 RepID=A0A4S2N8B6_9PEZI|nr:zf-UBP-domain-containing protein [Ascodesmis nigricans]